MKEFFVNVGAVSTAILAVIGVGGAIWSLIKKPWKRVTSAMEQVDRISNVLGPNGGRAVIDVVERIEKDLAVVSEKVTNANREIAKTAARVTGISDHIERPMFEADHDGDWARVNRSFEQTFGYSNADCVVNGWIAMLHPEDRERVVRDWKFAVEDQRSFRSQARVQTRPRMNEDQPGFSMTILLKAEPTTVVGRPGDQVVGWFGCVEILNVQTPGVAA